MCQTRPFSILRTIFRRDTLVSSAFALVFVPKNIRALVGVIGAEHVCIDRDTKLTPPCPASAPADFLPQVLARTALGRVDLGLMASALVDSIRASVSAPRTRGRMKRLAFTTWLLDAMLKTGFTPHEIGKIGCGNFLRLFGQAVKNWAEGMTMRGGLKVRRVVAFLKFSLGVFTSVAPCSRAQAPAMLAVVKPVMQRSALANMRLNDAVGTDGLLISRFIRLLNPHLLYGVDFSTARQLLHFAQ